MPTARSSGGPDTSGGGVAGTDPHNETPGGAPIPGVADTGSDAGGGTGPVSSSPAGADGNPKRLHLADLRDTFGPIEVDGASYTLTPAGVEVAGPHVEAVRAAAKHAHVKLRTTAIQQ